MVGSQGAPSSSWNQGGKAGLSVAIVSDPSTTVTSSSFAQGSGSSSVVASASVSVASVAGAVVAGAHYDTKSGIPGFVGANDGASGVGVLLELARGLPWKASCGD